MSETPNEFEVKARARKAMALAETIRLAGGTAASAALLSPAERNMAAAAARVHKPSDLTWQLVLQMLANREQEADEDPFYGLGA